MSKRVLLISEQQIKNQSTIEANVDGKVLSKCIANVQEIQLKAILGAELYSETLAAVEANIANGATLSTEQQMLLNDFIQPYLLHAAIADFIVVNQYKVTNKGVLKMNDNSATNLSPDELHSFKNHFDTTAQAFKNQLIEHLSKCKLTTAQSDVDKTSGSIGWYF